MIETTSKNISEMPGCSQPRAATAQLKARARSLNEMVGPNPAEPIAAPNTYDRTPWPGLQLF